MNVHEAIRTRSSVREYLPIPVPDEQVMKVLEAARLAPSSSNRQQWRFIVVRDEDRRRRLAQAAHNQMWIAGAPVIIAAIGAEPSSIMTCGLPRHAVDVSIAITHMMLAAVEEGLGTCWIGKFSQDEVREILAVSDDSVVVTIMPLGYYQGCGTPKSRKTIEDIVRYETDGPQDLTRVSGVSRRDASSGLYERREEYGNNPDQEDAVKDPSPTN